MSRLGYQVLFAEAEGIAACSDGAPARILSTGSAVAVRALRVRLLTALSVQMIVVAAAGTTSGGTWEIGAFTSANVFYQGLPGSVPVVDSSNVFAAAPVAAATSASFAIQGESTASAVSTTFIYASPDFRSGVFSSDSRAAVALGLSPVTLGANAFGGSGGVNWQSDVNEETLNIAFAFVGRGGGAFIDVDSSGGAFDIAEGTGLLKSTVRGNEHRLTMSAGPGAVANGLTPEDFSQFVVAWGRNRLPGLSVMDPFLPQTGHPPGTFQFTVPVMQDYGIGSTLYFDPVFAHGYLYKVDGSRFASFTIPNALPNGDELFQLEFDGITYDLTASSVFDFTRGNALGASQFILRGIGLDEMVDPDVHPPFVSGFTFTSEGIANVSQIALIVPEPSALGSMIVAIAIAGCRRSATLRMKQLK